MTFNEKLQKHVVAKKCTHKLLNTELTDAKQNTAYLQLLI